MFQGRLCSANGRAGYQSERAENLFSHSLELVGGENQRERNPGEEIVRIHLAHQRCEQTVGKSMSRIELARALMLCETEMDGRCRIAKRAINVEEAMLLKPG